MPKAYERVRDSEKRSGKSDKEAYLYLRWYIRKHRRALETQWNETLRNLMLYGYDPHTSTRALWDNGEDFYGTSIVDQIKDLSH